MARKQTRRSISISQTAYELLKAHCERQGSSLSGWVEGTIRAEFGMEPNEKTLSRDNVERSARRVAKRVGQVVPKLDEAAAKRLRDALMKPAKKAAPVAAQISPLGQNTKIESIDVSIEVSQAPAPVESPKEVLHKFLPSVEQKERVDRPFAPAPKPPRGPEDGLTRAERALLAVELAKADRAKAEKDAKTLKTVDAASKIFTF